MFADLAGLLRRFSELGAVRAFCKPLAENDNSKQQIYLGGNFDVVQMFPFENVEATSNGKDSTYKAKLNFAWIDADKTEQAAGAQLILYPQYPEVRLSGFLRGCKRAPNELLRPIPASQRRFNNGPDGRILFFGITRNGETLAYLAPAESSIAQEFRQRQAESAFSQESVFFNLPLQGRDSRIMLLERLSEIRKRGWQPSISLKKDGIIVPYKASNGGGYTLEALLGIIRNSISEPDFMGWEIKAYSKDRITLITPEPDGGMYGEDGVKAFVRKYGKPSGEDTLYFTGTHRADCRNEKTGLTLVVRGFNPSQKIIEDVGGAVELLTDKGRCEAAWSFAHLLIKWNKKHAHAAYIRYKGEKVAAPTYRYLSPALLGEGTDFNRYLAALCAGLVILDPGSKVMNASTEKSTVKARSQFRMSVRHLAELYQKFGPVEF
ncbi:MAG: MvaI/BcnI restriction endonuclease family protein [Nitrosomonadales bacterium]|nr:MvaI/BcnI restriction endonuclease family protein [Nitrosomonadales bacterium]